jgi:anaerobic selenocysteine-containing dehydrogenase
MKILKPAKRIIICWAMGLTQHKNGIDNIFEVVNLLLMKGAIGKPGAGTCPVRGHSNVQGDRTVGINHKISEKQREAINSVYGFLPPAEQGADVVECIVAMHEQRAKFFMSLGGNFLTAASDTHYTVEAMESCDLTVHVSTKLNRTHLHPGQVGLILPTLGRSELDKSKGQTRYVTVENSMGKVQPSKGSLEPISDKLMSEPMIIQHWGRRVLAIAIMFRG